MKTLSTVAMLCLAFWAGGHFIIVPRLEQAAGQQGKPQTHTKSVAVVKHAPARARSSEVLQNSR